MSLSRYNQITRTLAVYDNIVAAAKGRQLRTKQPRKTRFEWTQQQQVLSVVVSPLPFKPGEDESLPSCRFEAVPLCQCETCRLASSIPPPEQSVLKVSPGNPLWHTLDRMSSLWRQKGGFRPLKRGLFLFYVGHGYFQIFGLWFHFSSLSAISIISRHESAVRFRL